MDKFVHLHLHSHYSLLDGAIKIDDIIGKAIEFNMSAAAITDHGNMFGAIEFYEKALKKSVKPVIGCEMYVSRSDMTLKNPNEKLYYHLILLAKNEEGYQNLSRLISKSYTDGFYYKPRIDKNILKENHSGLIALSACLKGEIPYNLIQGKMDLAEKSLQYYLEIFGDDFYLEMQMQGIEEQKRANAGIVELSKKYGVPLVATNDCHYLLKDDYEAHDVLLCIQTGKTVEDKDRMRFSTKDLYFKSQEEMIDLFSGYPAEAISNTKIIESKCNFSFKLKGGHYFPQFIIKAQDGVLKPCISILDFFEKKVKEGFDERFIKNPTAMAKESYLNNTEAYEKRLNMEIEVIKKSNFAGYFLIVSDFIRYAKDNDIPVGPGRGSAAGSLVAYCLKITDIDPIKYDLMFERFLNPERISMPDIDSDFCINGRDEVIKYVSRKYGEENVSQIITFGTMQAKAAIRDTGRALNMPYAEVDKIAKLVPNTLGITLEEAIKEEPKLQNLIKTDFKVKKLIEIARRLEGLARHASTHAAGVVISSEPILRFMPLYKGSKETDVITTQYTGQDLEKLGFIKFDFLGLKTLTVMNEAIKLINDKKTELASKHAGQEHPSPLASPAPVREENDFNIYDIDLNDQKTYKLLSSGDTTGVFQLESSGMKELIKKLAPESFEDLIPLVALYRPGPLGSGMVDDFINAKHGRVKIRYIHPLLKDILSDTYGVILYQEQIMRIATSLAGFSMGEADVLRKGVGKKQAELIAQMKDKFISGCENKGIDKNKAEKIFSLITKFGEYGFNKSHSTAYAYIAYMTAYLKANYKEHFTAALLSSEMSNTDKLAKIINEAKSGFYSCEILPPSVNFSMERFTIVSGSGNGLAIRVGLGAVKNVGKSAIDSILQMRQDGLFKGLLDFCSRVDTRKVNKRTIENLIKSGALDINGESRKWMLDSLESVMEEANFLREKRNSDQFELPLFLGENVENGNGNGDTVFKAEDKKDDKKSVLAYEKESLGFYLSGHPLDGYEEKIKLVGEGSVVEIVNKYLSSGGKTKDEIYTICGVINQLKIHKTKNNEKMASFVLNDKKLNVQVLFFPKNYLKYEDIFNTNEPVVLTGRIDFSGLTANSGNEKNGIAKEVLAPGDMDDNFDEENYKGEGGRRASNDKIGDISEGDIELNIKIIGEKIEFLDSYKIKQKNNTLLPPARTFDPQVQPCPICVIEITEKEIPHDNDALRNFLAELKDALYNSKGNNKVILKAIGYEVILNGNIAVDKELLKSKPLCRYLNIA
ncbi:MAG: DNA polymerase III subunit alpha [Deltaproteobacteria bacterium]|jgi:DNA polymerase-3 subunit alpha|nr:DNA polymerase III subunit alpha [Deltaproteobacteria bacterium]MCL5880804.1 DNA polymerase III subunit alpha [Deltaproteobacteria bacterium]MDA8304270.1 DNA polymerase III subunit alpha [Deltaproteobacteria bacterium]